MKSFLIGLAVSAAFFLPYIIADRGYFLFYGDFNVQQVPFYQLAHAAIKNGEWFWSFKTDLGANFIGSYSFYLLGSPFFWLTIPFPNSFVPYLMGPLLILKFGCASFTAYCYITRFVKNKDYALIGALLYAFSGFSVYNIFFNHFHEAIIYFPLLLLSLEAFMTENRRGWFAVMIALCAVVNYFFFFGMAVFCLLYFFIRLFSGEWDLTIKKLLLLILEAALGVLMSCVLLLPSLLAIVSNSRVSQFQYGWNGLLYGKEQIYTYVIQSFFFPPELPARPVFFDSADVKWSSVAGWMPVFSMTGVFAWMVSKKKSWQKRLIAVCTVMALVPVLNAAFYAFNSSYYARWFYMPILIMALMTAKGLEDEQTDWDKGWKITLAITLGFVIIIGFFPNGRQVGGLWEKFGLYVREYGYRFWMFCLIAVASLVILKILLTMKKRGLAVFSKYAVLSVCLISVIYSALFVGLGKSHSYETTSFIIPKLLEADIELEDKDSVRFDVYEGMDNTAMFYGLSSIQAFHSVVPSSIMDFYTYLDIGRDVASRPETDYYALRSFLSVKYLLNYEDDDQFEGTSDADGTMPYWSYLETQNGQDIYINDCYIPYGFTYDYYISEEDSDSHAAYEKDLLLVKAIRLSAEQAEKYSGILKNYSELDVFSPDYDLTQMTVEQYYTDCSMRRSTAGSTVFGKNSFDCNITLTRDNLVFFSIPYDDGWSAYVDGAEVEIEKVNAGFMAVLCTEGEHTVHFEYRTPGLKIGAAITAGSATVLCAYLVFVCEYRKRKRSAVSKSPASPETEL
ncbi:MAG: YfhO family protein [Acutalibacteraceae bacterium]